MKKATLKAAHKVEEMRPEYDFLGGVRGKHAHLFREGYTVTIHKEDGTTEVKYFAPADVVVLAPDVREYFSDSESVNAALRSLIALIPKKRKITTKSRKTSSQQTVSV